LDGNLFHLTTTTQVGISNWNYATFNLGFDSGDDRENVYENRIRLASLAEVDIQSLFIPYQTHDDKICVIDEEFLSLKDDERYMKLQGVDAIITNQPDICIGITTADCVPILIFNPAKKIFAAIHAGWKGTVTRIAEKTIAKMSEHFNSNPDDLLVGIGPCISQKHFEVGNEVVDAFSKANFDMDKITCLNQESGKIHIDLQEGNKLTLENAGVLPENIEKANLCTYSNPEKLFSARRQTIHSGRMVTGGVLRY